MRTDEPYNQRLPLKCVVTISRPDPASCKKQVDIFKQLKCYIIFCFIIKTEGSIKYEV